MEKALRVGLLAGEASGDILGAGLMQGIRAHYPDAVFTGIGGPEMEKQGIKSMVPMERLSVMGLIDPLKRLPELLTIRKNIYLALKNDPPDVFVGIDSPDFNLGLEKKLRACGIPTAHYVSPSVWAWRQGRIKKIRQAVDLMLALFPFEEAFYQEQGVKVKCVGHPLADELPLETDTQHARQVLDLPAEGPVLAILPGSRAGEVEKLGHDFFATARLCRQAWPDLVCVIPCANPQREEQVRNILDQHYPDLEATLVSGRSREVMAAADCILMASGTATLEGMLLKKPMVVAYRMAPLSFAIISRMLRAPHIALPNLLAGERLVPEILQNDVTPDRLFAEIRTLLTQGGSREAMVNTFRRIHESLRRDANATAAQAVLELCQK